MKLYYTPSACSLASHILLREVGATFELERVDLARGATATGERYAEINPRGQVPALRVDADFVLTEGAAILQFIADRHPEAGFSPALGSTERGRLQQWLNFLSAELHPSFRPFFGQGYSEAEQERGRRAIERCLGTLEEALTGSAYLTGERISAADVYLFVMARWLGKAAVDVARWPGVAALVARVDAREAVRAALQTEAQGAAA